MKTNTILLIILLSVGYLLCFFQSGFSASATHRYDELNGLIQTVYDNGAKVTTDFRTLDPVDDMVDFTIFSDYHLDGVDYSVMIHIADACFYLHHAHDHFSGTLPRWS